MKSCKGKDNAGQNGNKRKNRINSSPSLVPPHKAVGLAQKLAEADQKMSLLSSPQPVRRMLHQQQDAVMVKSQSAEAAAAAVISEVDEPTSIG